jgi:hypothetical protein
MLSYGKAHVEVCAYLGMLSSRSQSNAQKMVDMDTSGHAQFSVIRY